MTLTYLKETPFEVKQSKRLSTSANVIKKIKVTMTRDQVNQIIKRMGQNKN